MPLSPFLLVHFFAGVAVVAIPPIIVHDVIGVGLPRIFLLYRGAGARLGRLDEEIVVVFFFGRVPLHVLFF